MPTILISIAAFASCAVFFAGLFAPWFLFGSHKSVVEKLALGYSTLLLVCGVLSARFWWNSPLIVGIIAAVAALSATVCGYKLISQLLVEDKVLDWFKSYSSYLKTAFLLLALYLIVDGIWATLPLYRYDQWTYHLVVSKWIDLLGTLQPPVAYDHIFFTGTYELLGLLPRFFSQNDAFQQGFQNGLSWCLVVFPAIILAGALTKGSNLQKILALLFAGLVLFASGDHEALVSAKPDYILMMVALLLLINVCIANRDDIKMRPTTAGFLIAGMLSFKITWLHFALAFSLFLFWHFWRTLGRRGVLGLVFGGLIGTIVVLPFLIKNWLIFANPLHPAQSSIWHSSLWNPELTVYWQNVTHKPVSAIEYARMFCETVVGLPGRWTWLLFVTAGLLVINGKNSIKHTFRSHYANFSPLMFFGPLCVYLCIWGLFYGSSIFNRFVSPVFAFGLVFTVVPLLNQIRLKEIAFLMTVPLLLNGQIEVSLKRIWDARVRTVSEYHDHMAKSPAGNNIVLRAIAEHRSQFHAGAGYDQAILLSDYPFNFYGPSQFFIATDPVTLWHLTSRRIDPIHGCAKTFFENVDIRYIWVHDSETLKKWPLSLQNVLKQSKKIQEFQERGILYYLDHPISC